MHGQTHCAACRHPLAHPVQQTQRGLMHAACAFQWAAPRTMRWNVIGAVVALVCLLLLLAVSR